MMLSLQVITTSKKMISLLQWSKKPNQLQNQRKKMKRRKSQYLLLPQLQPTQCQQLNLNLLLKPNPQPNHNQLPKLWQCHQKLKPQ
jgi:hypothetical protein